MEKFLVLHHSDQDGFGAAHAFYDIHRNQPEYAETQYVMMNYGQPAPLDKIDKDTHVFIFDFSFQLPVMKEIFDRAKSVILIDHHKSVQDRLEEYAKVTTDMYVSMDHSAAVLVWGYFTGKGMPKLYGYVDDFDRWQFKLPESKRINAAINSYPLKFEVWDDLVKYLEQFPEGLESEGTAILRFSERVMEVMHQQSKIVEFEGMKVLIANVLYPFISDFGNKMLEVHPEINITATFYTDKEGTKRWSLRSRGDVDVAKFAERFGGGGHRSSAGFSGEFL